MSDQPNATKPSGGAGCLVWILLLLTASDACENSHRVDRLEKRIVVLEARETK